jgi:hypothetical protein
MSTSDRDNGFAAQVVLTQPAWSGHIFNALVQHVLDCRISTAKGVANDHQVRVRLQLIGLIPLGEHDTLFSQQRAHGGVSVLIGTGHRVTRSLCQHCHSTHKSTAGAKYVNPLPLRFHRCLVPGGRGFGWVEIFTC